MTQMEEQLHTTNGRMQTVLSTIEGRSTENQNAKKMMTEVTKRVQQLEQRFDVLVQSTDDILRVVRGHREGPQEVKGVGKKKSVSSIHTQPSSMKKHTQNPSVAKPDPKKTEKKPEKAEQSSSDKKS